MKKLGKLLLCVGLLFSIAACGKKDPVDDKALDKLAAVMKQSKKIKSASYQMHVKTTADKETAKITANGSFVISEKPQFSFLLDMSANGQTYEDFADIYVYENMLYINMMGSKMKTPYASAEGIAKGFTEDGTKKDRKSLKKLLKKAAYGNDTITLVLDGKKITKSLQKESEDTSALPRQYKNMSYKDIKLEITYDEKEYLTGLKAALKMTANDETAKASFDLKLTERDRIIDIDLPENLNEYLSPGTSDQSALSLIPGQGL